MEKPGQRPFGTTGLSVPVLGLGCGAIGDTALDEKEVGRLLNAAVDMGVTFFDTARSYGLSEERLGRHLAHRRAGVILSTKVGYGIVGYEDWTGPCVAAGIEAALARLHTDAIDVVHLHSCPLHVLKQGDVIEALEGAVTAGKVRAAAYSGENEALEWAVASGRFAVVQASVNLLDQRSLDAILPDAAARGLGVIAKRPLAGAPWRPAMRPEAPDLAAYWDRWRALGFDPAGLEWEELALRFAAFAPGVSTCIAGTRDADHLRRNVSIAAKGPLPAEIVAGLRAAYRAAGAGWPGIV